MTTTLSVFIAVSVIVLLALLGLVFVLYMGNDDSAPADPAQEAFDFNATPATPTARRPVAHAGGHLAGR